MPLGQHTDRQLNTRKRTRALGRAGEVLAVALLGRNGFYHVLDLNQSVRYAGYADIFAVKDGIRYVIAVVTRNKWQIHGPLNPRYKLGVNAETSARAAEAEWNAVAAWLTIAVDEATYSACFGLLSELKLRTGVPMSDAATARYVCLAADERHNISAHLLERKFKP